MTAPEPIKKRQHDEINVTQTTKTVASTGTTTLITSELIQGRKGNFTVDNKGANTIVVFPQVSNDDTVWYEMDNGSGTSQATTIKKVYPFLGNYKYVRIVATAGTASAGVVTDLYLASI